MIVAFGSDIKTAVTDAIEGWLRERGHGVVLEGVLATGDDSWPRAGRDVALAVAEGRAQSGIVCCWTGTGVSIAANKVSGVRAALC
ncbi:MAG: RpiB/LacA/LacB family sugar-phosphate isomerase, partial [Candidatus Eremiobacteraeota bacterium]|nr:RpiB/LacA/LacB family sugar-phosphate isomerase [Candidatus Eremiobacteraeota bacterium]